MRWVNLLFQPERGFGIAIITNSWSGDAIIWELIFRIFYLYNILPTNGQRLGIGYSVMLFLAMLLTWPIRRFFWRTKKTEGATERCSAAIAARIILVLTIITIMVLSLLYRDPLTGNLVYSLSRGEPIITKALLGIFFSTPIFLILLTFLVWRKKVWSAMEWKQYVVLLLGALIGIFLLRDLWSLMFWG